jgi:hypothetical protein
MKRKLLVISVVLAFTAPIVIATLLHSQWLTWRPDSTRNYGTLIQPVVPLPDFEILTATSEPLSRGDLLDQWQLVHLRHAPCDEQCLEALYWLRQVRRAQDRHQPEVALLVIATSNLGEQDIEAIREVSEHFRIIDGPAGERLAEAFPEAGSERSSYILDPMANIILKYEAEADPNDLRRDLDRLLTWTQRD